MTGGLITFISHIAAPSDFNISVYCQAAERDGLNMRRTLVFCSPRVLPFFSYYFPPNSHSISATCTTLVGVASQRSRSLEAEFTLLFPLLLYICVRCLYMKGNSAEWSRMMTTGFFFSDDKRTKSGCFWDVFHPKMKSRVGSMLQAL